MKHILLLGAGFSRNWGGWLASEAFEYLIGHPKIIGNNALKQLLWNKQLKGGFEEALAQLQDDANKNPAIHKDNLKLLESSILDMFNDMNKAFQNIKDENGSNDWDLQGTTKMVERSFADFLGKFDAIYTLNQDLLLEYHYIGSSSKGYLPNIIIHGDMILNPYTPTQEWGLSKLTPDNEINQFKVPSSSQPIYKLHGSSNWVNSDGQPLLILGGNKQSAIKQLPILGFYLKQFETDLSLHDTRLMVIGYGFGDLHINYLIESGIEHGLKMFNINPDGAEQAKKPDLARNKDHIPGSRSLEENFEKLLIGASRRSLKEIFGNDTLEHSKVMRFFKS
jgi:hypothetical protein